MEEKKGGGKEKDRKRYQRPTSKRPHDSSLEFFSLDGPSKIKIKAKAKKSKKSQ